MIIAFTGKRGSGKSTAAAYLIKEHEFELRAFADPLKKSFAALFDIRYHEIEKFKNDPNTFIEIRTVDTSYENEYLSGPVMTFREALQRYGTEAHRDIFGEDFWVDLALPLPPVGFYVGRKIVIHDCRFLNEAYRVKQLGGYVIDIKRPPSDQPQHRGWENHVSESEMDNIPKDVVIKNDGTISDLYIRIEAVLSTVLDYVGHERTS
jgi:hypothetical protein